MLRRDQIELRYDEIMLLDNPETKHPLLSPIVANIMDAKINTLALYNVSRAQLTAMTHSNLVTHPATKNEILLTNHFNIAFGEQILALARDTKRLKKEIGVDGLARIWHFNVNATEDMFAFLCYTINFCMLTTKSTKAAQAMDSTDASFFPRGGLCRGEPRNIEQGLRSLGLIVVPGTLRDNVESVFLRNFYTDMTPSQYMERAVVKLTRAIELYEIICTQTLQRGDQLRSQPVLHTTADGRKYKLDTRPHSGRAPSKISAAAAGSLAMAFFAFCENKAVAVGGAMPTPKQVQKFMDTVGHHPRCAWMWDGLKRFTPYRILCMQELWDEFVAKNTRRVPVDVTSFFEDFDTKYEADNISGKRADRFLRRPKQPDDSDGKAAASGDESGSDAAGMEAQDVHGSPAAAGKKRARDEGAQGSPAAAGKKRARDEGAQGSPAAAGKKRAQGSLKNGAAGGKKDMEGSSSKPASEAHRKHTKRSKNSAHAPEGSVVAEAHAFPPPMARTTQKAIPTKRTT